MFDVVSVVNNFKVFSSPLHPYSASIPSNSCNFPFGNIIVKWIFDSVLLSLVSLIIGVIFFPSSSLSFSNLSINSLNFCVDIPIGNSVTIISLSVVLL